MDWPTLQGEIANDPLGRNYSGMTDQQVADSLNTKNRTVERSSVSGSEIFNAIVPSEYDSLLATTQERVKWITQLGDSVDIASGSNARQVLLNAFDQNSTTHENLVDVVQIDISRAVELGLQPVLAEHVSKVRSWL